MATTLQNLIDEVRLSLEDAGATTTDNFSGDGSTTIWRLTTNPIGANTDTVTVASATQTRGTDYTINYDNGEITFTTAPVNGASCTVQYTAYVWRDSRIRSALNAGIRSLYPRVFKPFEVYVLLRNNVWIYDLTDPTDVPESTSFGDQTIPADYIPADSRDSIARSQARIHYAEWRVYGSNQVFVPYSGFRRTTRRNLQIDRSPGANDTLRLTCSGPFKTLENVGDATDVPSDFLDLPVWYALGTLLAKKEGPRARSDSYAVQQNENANRPGTQAQAGNDHLRMYSAFLRDNAMRPLAMKQRTQARPWEHR